MRKHINNLFLLGMICLYNYALCAEPTKSVKSIYTKEPPKIDGKLDDSCWKEAKPHGDFTMLNSSVPAKNQTSFKICHDDDYVYFAVECFDKDIKELLRKIKNGEAKHFSDNSVEIFLDPKSKRWDYYYVCVTPDKRIRTGYFYDTGLVGNLQYEIDADVAVSFTESSWIAEVAIPLSDLGMDENVKNYWLFNVARLRGTSEIFTYAPIARGTLQNSDNFVKLSGMKMDTKKFRWEIAPPYLHDTKQTSADSLAVTINAFLKNETGTFGAFVLKSRLIAPSGEKTDAFVLKSGLGTSLNREFTVFNGTVSEEGYYTLNIFLKTADKKVLQKKNFPVYIKNRPVEMVVLSPRYRNGIYPGQDIRRIVIQMKSNIASLKIESASLELVLKAEDGNIICSQNHPDFNVENNYSLNIPNLSPGTYTLVALINDKNKNLYKDAVEINSYPKPEKGSVVWVGDDNNLYVNGQVFFPFGFWGGASNQSSTAKEDVDHGINFALYNGFSPDYGIKSIAGIFAGRDKQHLLQSAPLSPVWKELLERRVAEWKERPDLIAYYMPDEPNGWGGSVAAIQEAYELIKKLDPYHPCYMSLSGTTNVNQWYGACDIFGVHNYPCFLKGGGPVRDFERTVVDSIKRLITATDNGKPIWYMAQVFNYSRYPNNRVPNYLEMRCQDYLAVISGAKGLNHYLYYYFNMDNFWEGTKKERDATRIGMLYIAKEFSVLGKVILTGKDITDKIKISPADTGVHYLALQSQGNIYILAANSREKHSEVTFTPEILLPATLNVFCESRNVRIENGKFKDVFAPLEVHVYTSNADIDKTLVSVKDVREIINQRMD